jgi:hypothetical protein
MTLTLATLIPGLLLVGLGVPLAMNNSAWTASLKRFPRSQRAAYLFFGVGAAWFLYAVWHLSAADFGDYRGYLFVAFAAIAVLSFKCVPDFLAVRGLSAAILMAAMPLLDAAYMEYDKPQRLLMVTLVYVAIAFAIWLGGQPWRLRDFLTWLFTRPERTRAFGGLLTAYGLLLAAVAFTY